jgi:hypothetical protein
VWDLEIISGKGAGEKEGSRGTVFIKKAIKKTQ